MVGCDAMQNDTKDLEKAAGEMAQAASRLVEIERNIVHITQDGVSSSTMRFCSTLARALPVLWKYFQSS